MKKPKILFFDIETAPNLAWTWGKYFQHGGSVIEIAKEWELLSVAWKWQGDSKVSCVTREGRSSDKNVAKKLHDLFSEADILVAHNGDEFDIKKAKARFIANGLPPTPMVASVDTRKAAKKHFAFTSNSLNDLGVFLKLGKKAKHNGFDTWKGCIADKPSAWALMEKYNKKDVVLLEKVYEALAPWMHRHPNTALMSANEGCPVCGNSSVQRRGFNYSYSSKSQRWHCQNCGNWFSTTVSKKIGGK